MNNSALQLSFDKSSQRYMTSAVRGPTAKSSASKVSTYKLSSYAPLGSMAGSQLYSSRSEPGLAWQHTMPKSSVPSQRHSSSRDTYRREVSKSQYIANIRPQPRPTPAINGTGPTRARSQFVCNPVDVSTLTSKPPVDEFSKATLKDTSG